MTLGVRICVLTDHEVLLVRHTYAPGWQFPGGGVDRGETVFEAAVRELREECGVIAHEHPRLHGLFSNEEHFRGDHIACLVVRDFTLGPWAPTFEIAESRFFARDALPAGTTPGTVRRIEEISHGADPRPGW